MLRLYGLFSIASPEKDSELLVTNRVAFIIPQKQLFTDKDWVDNKVRFFAYRCIMTAI